MCELLPVFKRRNELEKEPGVPCASLALSVHVASATPHCEDLPDPEQPAMGHRSDMK